MNVQGLRYVVQINEIGSINKASQQLYVSQSTLSRAVQEIEEATGIIIFQRTNKGVVTTYEGKRLIERATQLLKDIDSLENEFFVNKSMKAGETALLLGAQRSYPAVVAFLDFYKKKCQEAECLNLVLREGTREEILGLIYSQILDIGIVHCLSVEEEAFLEECKNMTISGEIIYESQACVQVRENHPLADKTSVTLEMLDPYPRVAFLDEDITGINYCSDVLQYDRNVLKKRIVVQERGTQREIIHGTDGYYIGNYYDISTSVSDEIKVPTPIKCIPLENADIFIKTVLIYRESHRLNSFEKQYLRLLKELLANNN